MRFFFFFSSRRRHTRCSRDWSSDVCSSDLAAVGLGGFRSASSFSFLIRAVSSRRFSRGFSSFTMVPRVQAISACLAARSEEHTSELQSRLHLVCRLLLEKKKKNDGDIIISD